MTNPVDGLVGFCASCPGAPGSRGPGGPGPRDPGGGRPRAGGGFRCRELPEESRAEGGATGTPRASNEQVRMRFRAAQAGRYGPVT
ncbi:hypothetical protein EAO74_06195 [Streptomyces sp. gb1(2016)]|uniref:Uncharacterized protein n=1 Tax=Streptomyces sp. gb1(2016) TaxID=1828321 RepID=A0A652L9W1_9ACTN|nr:hypothetical protein EAO74_06195 [Streptomyces sp. gb1(2016)]